MTRDGGGNMLLPLALLAHNSKKTECCKYNCRIQLYKKEKEERRDFYSHYDVDFAESLPISACPNESELVRLLTIVEAPDGAFRQCSGSTPGT